MPQEVVELINREVAKATATPEVKRQLEDATIVPQTMTTAEFKAFIGRETERWTPLIKRITAKKHNDPEHFQAKCAAVCRRKCDHGWKTP